MSENSRRISPHFRMICCDSNEFGKTHLNSTINEAVASGEVSSVALQQDFAEERRSMG
ncbi:hypothetical protein [Pectobacterium brasiliense]|uniref:hypothetical protein n=1 Tax=Pectobacterium brasiliense TaxID=180957 RepID=UPI000AAA5605|nr:hypothetical protein [Pectobacterium brasiliense]